MPRTMRFVDPSQILAFANIERGATVASFGCGNGFFPTALAKAVGDRGTVYAVDVVEASLEATVSAAKHENVKNIYTIRHDLEKPGVPIEENSCDYVLLTGILHQSKSRSNVLRESYRVLKTGGRVIVIEWKKERLPFGPDINQRVSEQELYDIMSKSGFQKKNDLPADHFHYAVVFEK